RRAPRPTPRSRVDPSWALPPPRLSSTTRQMPYPWPRLPAVVEHGTCHLPGPKELCNIRLLAGPCGGCRIPGWTEWQLCRGFDARTVITAPTHRPVPPARSIRGITRLHEGGARGRRTTAPATTPPQRRRWEAGGT